MAWTSYFVRGLYSGIEYGELAEEYFNEFPCIMTDNGNDAAEVDDFPDDVECWRERIESTDSVQGRLAFYAAEEVMHGAADRIDISVDDYTVVTAEVVDSVPFSQEMVDRIKKSMARMVNVNYTIKED